MWGGFTQEVMSNPPFASDGFTSRGTACCMLCKKACWLPTEIKPAP